MTGFGNFFSGENCMETIYIGIDWSRDFVDLAIINGDGNLLLGDKILITKDGFKKLDSIIDRFQNQFRIVAGIESCEHILAGYLRKKQIPLHEVNPRKLHRFKEIYSLTGQKDDRYDAKMIALYVLKNINTCQNKKIRNEESSRLMKLNSNLDILKKDRARLVNRLKNNLQSYFPYFSRCFRDITKPVLSALKIIQSPEKLETLTLEDFLKETNDIQWSDKRKTSLFEKLCKESPDYISPIQNECIQYTESLIDQINLLDTQIKKTKSTIDKNFKNYEGSNILSSIPAVGTTIGGVLLSELSNDTLEFTDYRAFQSYAGTSPVTKQSGKTMRKVTMRYACNKNLRHALYWLAFNSITRVDWARQFYDKQRSKGKKNSIALRSLSNKWAKIIFSMWKHQTPYSPDFFETNQKKKNLLTGFA